MERKINGREFSFFMHRHLYYYCPITGKLLGAMILWIRLENEISVIKKPSMNEKLEQTKY